LSACTLGDFEPVVVVCAERTAAASQTKNPPILMKVWVISRIIPVIPLEEDRRTQKMIPQRIDDRDVMHGRGLM
jgi:hypothetical protein